MRENLKFWFAINNRTVIDQKKWEKSKLSKNQKCPQWIYRLSNRNKRYPILKFSDERGKTGDHEPPLFPLPCHKWGIVDKIFKVTRVAFLIDTVTFINIYLSNFMKRMAQVLNMEHFSFNCLEYGTLFSQLSWIWNTFLSIVSNVNPQFTWQSVNKGHFKLH